MKVLLSGYYGFRNIGDDAVCLAIIKGLKDKQSDLEIKTLSRRSIFELFNCDLFISGGGTLFQNATSNLSFYYYIGLVWLAKIFGKKVMILGQGFGPLRGWLARTIARFILNQVDIITLRDKTSYNELKSLGVNRPQIELTADPTLILDRVSEEKGKRILNLEAIPKYKPLIGIAARSLIKKNSQKLFKNIAEVLDWFEKIYNYQPVFIIFQSPPDLEAASDILHEMQEKYSLVFRFCHPDEMLSVISQFDLLIGMRLHSLIFALINQIPMLGISYDPKVKAFMDDIGQTCLSIEQAEDFEILKNEIEKVYINKDVIRKNLESKIKELSERAKRNFDFLSAKALRREEEINFSGIKVDNYSLAEATNKASTFLNDSKPHLIVTPNPEIIVAAQNDSELKEIINHAPLRSADGISMVVVSKILRTPLKERVSGIDLMLKILEHNAGKGIKVFLLGSAPGVAEEAAIKIIKMFPGINIVGTHHGYFKQDDEVIKLIKDSRPDILFVGLGAGRQEKWLSRYLSELQVKIGMVIGGSLDVISGRKKRAPVWIQKLYIEWLYRLFTEPSRWERQLALPKFLYLTLIRKML